MKKNILIFRRNSLWASHHYRNWDQLVPQSRFWSFYIWRPHPPLDCTQCHLCNRFDRNDKRHRFRSWLSTVRWLLFSVQHYHCCPEYSVSFECPWWQWCRRSNSLNFKSLSTFLSTGITNFDLLGDFGEIEWLGSFQIVLMYNLIFGATTTLCLVNKFTATVRQELCNRLVENYVMCTNYVSFINWNESNIKHTRNKCARHSHIHKMKCEEVGRGIQ